MPKPAGLHRFGPSNSSAAIECCSGTRCFAIPTSCIATTARLVTLRCEHMPWLQHAVANISVAFLLIFVCACIWSGDSGYKPMRDAAGPSKCLFISYLNRPRTGEWENRGRVPDQIFLLVSSPKIMGVFDTQKIMVQYRKDAKFRHKLLFP